MRLTRRTENDRAERKRASPTVGSMDRTDRAPTDGDPIGSPTTPRSGQGTEQRGGGRAGNPTGPRDANDAGSTRYGHVSGSGRNEPADHERKEEAGFPSRQGGDQTAVAVKENGR